MAALVRSSQNGILPDEVQAAGVHRDETLEECQHGPITAVSLNPEVVITDRTHLGGILVLLVGFSWATDPKEETGQVLMRPTLCNDQPDLVLGLSPLAFQLGDTLSIGKRAFVDKGGDHADLAIFGPCNKGISLV